MSERSALIGEHINLIDLDRPDDECDVTYLWASGGAAWRAGGAQVGVVMPRGSELVARIEKQYFLNERQLLERVSDFLD